jgi:predicted Zn-dependent peptidase
MLKYSKKVVLFSSLLIAFATISFITTRCKSEKYKTETGTDKNGYKFETVTNDPIQARIYTLKNGLKVYLSKNTDEPRLATLIAVKAGSTSDPVETTGLAHYFEHMMFKGTSKIATLDWEKEKVVLDQITDLFEQYRSTVDSDQKKAIYLKIDSLSQVASTFVAPNEYDKLVSGLGAKRTNAGTSYESTVYINDIPSNEFDKWLKLESERFSNMVLRLFHTELETVYEEFNMYQDQDRARAGKAMMESLFPNHPYGRDVIGLPEHLKNPSIKNIYKFAETWYKPNNMAIAISGDIDPEEAIVKIDKYFGKLESNPDLPKIDQPKEEPIHEPVIKEVVGPDAESVSFAFRFDGVNSRDYKIVSLIDNILSNSQAGLIDIDLNQQQKVLRGRSSSEFMRDYGMHSFSAQPRKGQTLDEVKDLLLGEIEKVKNGEFDDWMIEAVVNDIRISEIRRQENNFSRAFQLVDVFISNTPYKDKLAFTDELEKITKQEIMAFAKEKYSNNYVVVYKRTGENKDLVKVEKPSITPIEINRNDQSDFYQDFISEQVESIKPVFIDFRNEIQTWVLASGVEINYIENKTNELFNLQYILDMGTDNNLKLPLAMEYLPYLGTGKYSPEDLQKEFFKYGLSMNVNTGNDRCFVNITGLQKYFEKGVELLEHVMANVKPDEKAYKELVKGILKKRQDAKLNKNTILWSGLVNYGKYGSFNPFTNIIKEEELINIDPAELTQLITGLASYKHRLFYYGKENLNAVIPIIDKFHKVPVDLKPYPPAMVYPEQATDKNQVYLVNYDMSQVNIVLLAKGPAFSAELIPPSRLFGEYFGRGLSSIIFQEIREAKGLAYSAYSEFSAPAKKDHSYYVTGFVGTQSDKLKNATDAMLGLMNDMPKAQKQFDLARESMAKQIESERIIKTNIFWTNQRNLDLGIDYDIRRDVYDYVQTADLEGFSRFFDENIKDSKYSVLIMGNKAQLDANVLKQLGNVHELTLKEIYGY